MPLTMSNKQNTQYETAVIIANLNGKKILRNCLDTLRAQTYRGFKIYVVDNGSVDGSARMIQREYQEVMLIKGKENAGFARANNIGIRQAFAENGEILRFVCPLNNDIELDQDYLQRLVEAAKKYQAADVPLGILAAKLLFAGERRVINTVGTVVAFDGSGMERGFKEKDEKQYREPEEIFGSCAAACLYTRKMLEAVSYENKAGEACYFDDDFFAYYEDLDLNYRSRLSGFKSFYVPGAVGYHLHSATGKSYSPFKSFHVHRNQYYVLIKNFPFPYLLQGLFFMPIRYFLLLLSVLIDKGPSAGLRRNTEEKGVIAIVLSGWWDIITSLPSLMRKRWDIQKKRAISRREFGSLLRDYKASIRKMIFT